jgi:hypothetical protein
MPIRKSALTTWKRISALPLPAGVKKTLYRAVYVLPLGPGDPATLTHVVRRHRAFFAAAF